MKVVKIGGSLEQSADLVDILKKVVIKYPNGLVVVPGGGIFADQVRQTQQRWGFNDAAAHHMAILAMQQMGLLFNALNPQLDVSNSIIEIERLLESGRRAIWLPDIYDLNEAGIPAGWQVTSDSLAAWLAGRLEAEELILIKSGTLFDSSEISELIGLGIVDQAFDQYTRNSQFKITITNQSKL